jgi:hypothetical protein
MLRTGATRVYPFSHIVRRQAFEKALELSKNAPADQNLGFTVSARFVHVDQSYRGAQQCLEYELADEVEKLSKTRWGIINVWRPIAPIRREPLAVCDASTVDEADLIPSEIVLPKKTENSSFAGVVKGASFESWRCYANPQHRWYYKSNMTPEEVVFIKCFDSKKDRARRSPHTAFVDPKTEHDPRPRESIEVRCLVFWEDQ